jgi:hypothetical protein
VLRSPPACTAHGRETTGGSRPAGDEERRPAGRAHKLVALVHLEVAPAAAARRGRGVPLLHLPHDLHEVVDGAGQLEQAVAAGEAVLGLGLVQERPEQRVVGAPRAHHEPLLVRAHQDREAPRRRLPCCLSAGLVLWWCPANEVRHRWSVLARMLLGLSPPSFIATTSGKMIITQKK